MFLLPALFLPLVFGLAIHRLYEIPQKLWRGELQLPGRQRALLYVVTMAAYLALLGYTIALGIALAQALLVAEDLLSAYLALLRYVAGYPLVYFVAAWVFYYGLRPNPPSHQ